MSVVPVGETSDVFAGAAKQGVWEKLAQAVDAYCARRFERTVSDIALRRSKREIARCRQLVQNLPRCASEVTPAGAAALGPVLGGAACLIIGLRVKPRAAPAGSFC